MMKLKLNQTKKRIGIAVLLNIVIFLLALLLFEPTMKSDDYDIINGLYGGIDGKYSEFLLYSNVMLGQILVFLMNLMPNISWYFVLQYLLMFGANVVMVYIFLKKTKLGVFYSTIYLIFFAYEFYIRITFSKTAGFLIAAGYIFILYLLENRASKLLIAPATVCIFFGMLIRGSFFELITAIMFSSFVIYIKVNGLHNWKVVVSFAMIVLLLWGCSKGLSMYNIFFYDHNAEWKHYPEDNTYKALLVDYGVPSYDKYQEQYEQLGISRNDYTLWFSYAVRGDKEILTNDLMETITNIDAEETTNYISIIFSALKKLLTYWISNTAFYFFIFSVILFMLLNPPDKYYMVGLISIMCIFSYVYMYVMGRTQHHVDAVIYLLAAILVFYYTDVPMVIPKKQIVAAMTLCISLTLINRFYAEIASSSYYGVQVTGHVDSTKKWCQDNYQMYKQMSDDSDHLYVIMAFEGNLTYRCFTVFDVIPKGFYHNIYEPRAAHMPRNENILKEYGVNNIWRDSVNSDVIRFAISEQFSYQIDSIKTYINEHYDENAEFEIIDSIGTMNIYRIYTT